MILYLLALAQKVSSATFPELSTSRYFTMKRDGVGEEAAKGKEGGKKKARRKKDHFSKSVLLIHLAATVYQ